MARKNKVDVTIGAKDETGPAFDSAKRRAQQIAELNRKIRAAESGGRGGQAEHLRDVRRRIQERMQTERASAEARHSLQDRLAAFKAQKAAAIEAGEATHVAGEKMHQAGARSQRAFFRAAAALAAARAAVETLSVVVDALNGKFETTDEFMRALPMGLDKAYGLGRGIGALITGTGGEWKKIREHNLYVKSVKDGVEKLRDLARESSQAADIAGVDPFERKRLEAQEKFRKRTAEIDELAKRFKETAHEEGAVQAARDAAARELRETVGAAERGKRLAESAQERAAKSAEARAGMRGFALEREEMRLRHEAEMEEAREHPEKGIDIVKLERKQAAETLELENRVTDERRTLRRQAQRAEIEATTEGWEQRRRLLDEHHAWELEEAKRLGKDLAVVQQKQQAERLSLRRAEAEELRQIQRGAVEAQIRAQFTGRRQEEELERVRRAEELREAGKRGPDAEKAVRAEHAARDRIKEREKQERIREAAFDTAREHVGATTFGKARDRALLAIEQRREMERARREGLSPEEMKLLDIRQRIKRAELERPEAAEARRAPYEEVRHLTWSVGFGREDRALKVAEQQRDLIKRLVGGIDELVRIGQESGGVLPLN